MAVSASEKSRAAAVSALVKRDAGFRVTQSGSTRDQGIRVRTAGGRDGYPSISITDPFEAIHDEEEIARVIEYRRSYIATCLDKRGYTYNITWGAGETLCSIRVTGRGKSPKPTPPKTHTAKISFEIDPEAARQHLGATFRGDDSQLAAAMADAISEMIEVSNAASLGAIVVVKNEFVR